MVTRKSRNGPLCAVFAVLVVLVAGALAAPPTAPAYHSAVGNPVYPEINRCSSWERGYLRDAWKEGYRYTARAEQFMRHLTSQPADAARELWTRDFLGFPADGTGQWTSSPQRWFGSYDAGRAEKIQEALTTARKRFEGKTMYALACSNVCPKASAHHIVRGRIVTCPIFWDRARNTDNSLRLRRQDSAFTLVHEVHHHITMKVDGVHRFIEDFHTDGSGGHPNKKYYGEENVAYLARHVPKWAMRNNDTYASFAVAVDLDWEEGPLYNTVFAPKEGTGTGGFFVDLTWAGLIAKRDELAKTGQYIADVETYVRHGSRRYLAVWRIGDRDGGFYATSFPAFLANWSSRKGVQDLIDIEVYTNNGEGRLLGVYRDKAPGHTGDGGLFVDQTWDQIVAKQQAYAGGAYLADIETYTVGGKRRYAGVWRVGKGAGAVLRAHDDDVFDDAANQAGTSQQLLDLETFNDEDGRTWEIGVWRAEADYAAEYGVADPSGGWHSVETWAGLQEERAKWSSISTLIDLDDISVAALDG